MQNNAEMQSDECRMQNEDQNSDEFEREASLRADVDVVRQSIQQIKDGQCMEASAFFDQVRSQLLAIRADQSKGVPE